MHIVETVFLFSFFLPDVASHELTVNMQDGHTSQAKCRWAEESTGTFSVFYKNLVCGNNVIVVF